MSVARHLPIEVNAVQWTGDLEAMRELAIGDVDLARDSVSNVLWVTQNVRGRREVFPVAYCDWLVRDKTGVLVGMSQREFAASYAIVAA